VIYVRMSLDKTGDGAGIERQEEACRALALARGWQVAEVVSDVISATKVRAADRPGWGRVLAMIEADEVDVVIAWHLDRVCRSTRDLLDLIDYHLLPHNVAIATATGDIDLTTDVGRMVAKILAAVAEAEVERKAARQVLANEQRAVAGKPMWVRRPFGYNKPDHVGGEPTVNEAEAAVIRQAYTDLLRGKSLSAITRDFDASGLPTTIGNESWSLPTVRTILRSPRNAGLASYYGEVVADAAWPAIVEEATWKAAERLLSAPERHTGAGPLSNLLSGIAVCDVCESGVKVGWRGRKGEEGSYSYYTCAAQGHATLPVEWLDGYVLRQVVARAGDLDQTSFVPQDVPDLAPLREEAAKVREQMATLGEDYAEERITRATMLAATTRLRGRLAELERQEAQATRVGVWDYVDIEHLYEEFDGLPLDHQRAIVRAAFSRIGIKSRGRGRVLPRGEHVALRWTPEWTKKRAPITREPKGKVAV
jgi:DNA invertase Pin-like site-specific DNA recombinase